VRAGSARSASLEFTFNRDVSGGLAAGAVVEVYVGLSLDPEEELWDTQIGFNVIGATAIDRLAPVHRFELMGLQATQRVWTFQSGAVPGPNSDVLFFNTMSPLDPLTPPDYGVDSDLAAAAGFIPTSAPIGGVVLEAGGGEIVFEIVEEAGFIFRPRDGQLELDFSAGHRPGDLRSGTDHRSLRHEQ
jgi:hypothetical protein